MKRFEPMLLGALLLAASPAQFTVTTPAPMPDADVAAPPAANAGPPRPSVGPGLVRPNFGPTLGSQGYTAGSSYAETFDNRFRPMPGLKLSVPLQ